MTSLGVKSGLGEVTEWLMVPLSKSGLVLWRAWVRIPPSPGGEVLEWSIRRAWRARVAYGDRGFESHPLRLL